MLALTEHATEVIGGILASPGIPDSAGVRITTATVTTNGSGPTRQLQIELAAAPDDSDEVIEEEGARVFLEDVVAELLRDKQLDADRDGEQVRFSISAA
jgi:Fe-S cluster assembly iron-binding protein IscA